MLARHLPHVPHVAKGRLQVPLRLLAPNHRGASFSAAFSLASVASVASLPRLALRRQRRFHVAMASPDARCLDVVVYSRPGCGYCAKAKALLRRRQVNFGVVDVGAEPHRRAEAQQHGPTFPQILVGSRCLGGFDALEVLEKQGKLLDATKRAPEDKVYITPTPPEKIVAAALPEAIQQQLLQRAEEMGKLKYQAGSKPTLSGFLRYAITRTPRQDQSQNVPLNLAVAPGASEVPASLPEASAEELAALLRQSMLQLLENFSDPESWELEEGGDVNYLAMRQSAEWNLFRALAAELGQPGHLVLRKRKLLRQRAGLGKRDQAVPPFTFVTRFAKGDNVIEMEAGWNRLGLVLKVEFKGPWGGHEGMQKIRSVIRAKLEDFVESQWRLEGQKEEEEPGSEEDKEQDEGEDQEEDEEEQMQEAEESEDLEGEEKQTDSGTKNPDNLETLPMPDTWPDDVWGEAEEEDEEDMNATQHYERSDQEDDDEPEEVENESPKETKEKIRKAQHLEESKTKKDKPKSHKKEKKEKKGEQAEREIETEKTEGKRKVAKKAAEKMKEDRTDDVANAPMVEDVETEDQDVDADKNNETEGMRTKEGRQEVEEKKVKRENAEKTRGSKVEDDPKRKAVKKEEEEQNAEKAKRNTAEDGPKMKAVKEAEKTRQNTVADAPKRKGVKREAEEENVKQKAQKKDMPLVEDENNDEYKGHEVEEEAVEEDEFEDGKRKRQPKQETKKKAEEPSEKNKFKDADKNKETEGMTVKEGRQEVEEKKPKRRTKDEKAEEAGEAEEKQKNDEDGEEQTKPKREKKKEKDTVEHRGEEKSAKKDVPSSTSIIVDSDDDKEPEKAATFMDDRGEPLIKDERQPTEEQKEKADSIMREMHKTHRAMSWTTNDDIVAAQRKMKRKMKEDQEGEEEHQSGDDDDRLLRDAEEDSEDRKAARGRGRGKGKGRGRGRGRSKKLDDAKQDDDVENSEEPEDRPKKKQKQHPEGQKTADKAEEKQKDKSGKAKKKEKSEMADAKEKEDDAEPTKKATKKERSQSEKRDEDDKESPAKKKKKADKAATKSPMKLAHSASKRFVERAKAKAEETGDSARRRLDFDNEESLANAAELEAMDDTFELPEDLKAAHLKVKEGNQDGLHLARKTFTLKAPENVSSTSTGTIGVLFCG
ncbi:unnamed protein product [Cladocopium goreaui]|uniref:Glutaredoxin-3 n=1 Tax=Cladocopium goreaui TaxID=2562237 RepID=A0A9P1BVP4_9DINO|nr:unnamed protein product [Cladocopium goreaui]